MIRFVPLAAALVALVVFRAASVAAQPAPAPSPATPPLATPPAAAPEAPPAGGADSLADFTWLDGCWVGNVNQRDYREQWMPPRGGLALGVSQMVMGGRTTSYEYLRLESRPDGVYYVALPSDGKEQSFRYTGVTTDTSNDRNDRLYTFENPALEFPRRIIYRHAPGGWIYAQVEGKVGGADRQVIYPMRKVDCATGKRTGD
jgi:Domain of unknown function (DUF6265)